MLEPDPEDQDSLQTYKKTFIIPSMPSYKDEDFKTAQDLSNQFNNNEFLATSSKFKHVEISGSGESRYRSHNKWIKDSPYNQQKS